MLKITKENYDKMKIRLGQFTNFQEFIKKFEGSNVKWINKINES